MNLSPIDITIIIGYILFALGLGVYYPKRAGSNINEFFISGRNLPWWLAGTSMVATTFAAGTSLAVTGLVVEGGIAGNWLWWRVNAWSEISAITTTIVYILPQTKGDFAIQMLIIVPTSMLAWLIATWVTSPVSDKKLVAFYNRVQPNGGFWAHIPSLTNAHQVPRSHTPACYTGC